MTSLKSLIEKRSIICLVILGLMNMGFSFESMAWRKISAGINESIINCAGVQPKDKTIFAGTAKGIYRSLDEGRSYTSVLQMQGTGKGVNYIYINDSKPESILAATDSGLFESLDNGDHWDKIYNPRDTLARQCLTVIKSNDAIYVGTKQGLSVRFLKTPIWFKPVKDLSDKAVYRLAQDNDFLYASTFSDVYRIDKKTKAVIKIFRISAKEKDLADGIAVRDIKDLVVSSKKSRIYIAAVKGIFLSDDQGKSWQKLPSASLPLDDVQSLLVYSRSISSHGMGTIPTRSNCFTSDGAQIFVGTKRGAFIFCRDWWMPLYQGLETNDIRFLSYDSKGMLYAATAKGLFFMDVEEAVSGETRDWMHEPGGRRPGARNFLRGRKEISYEKIKSQFSYEPSIQQVHRLAVDYAEVHPDKIKQWRASARKKAWLPNLSMGIDVDKNMTKSDSLWGSYSNGGQHHVGPDDKTFYDNLGWDVSLSWDLGDVIWSSDQTSIDSRSKMMVELREDILDQVTRLYFERRRIQVELMRGKIETVPVPVTTSGVEAVPFSDTIDESVPAGVEKQMRIDELTALIDALTGGEFSRMLREKGREVQL